jgi:hypothetical protein
MEARQEFLRVTLPIFAASFAAVPVRFERVPYDPHAIWVTSPGGAQTVLAFDPVTHLPARFGDFTYADYRAVDGLMVPFTTTHDSRGYPHVWKVSRFRVDVKIAPRTFGR